MEKINLHQQKLYSLFIGAGALLGLILPWAVISFGGYGGFGGGNQSSNGFGGWGLLTLLGIIGVVVSSLMGDKTKEYDKNMKIVAISSFGAVILGAFIVFMQLSGNRGGMGFGGVKTGIGLWITLLAGVAGLLWVTGIIKLPPKKPTSPSK